MENIENGSMPVGGFIKQSLIVLLLITSIYLAEGLSGFKPILNLEAFLLVFGGTFLLTWTSYPLKRMFKSPGPEVLLFAAGRAVAMGALTTVLGTILLLASVDDAAEIPRRMALAFDGVLFGLFLSEVILVPIAARLVGAGGKTGDSVNTQGGSGKRVFLAFLALGAASFGLMTAVYALTTSFTDRSEKTGARITIDEGVLADFFESGSTDVQPAVKSIISELAPVLRKLAEKHDIVLEGHTDSLETSGRSRSAWELSSARASRIAEILTKKYGFPPERIIVRGCGASHPVASNTTEIGRVRNRRVVFYVQ